MVDNELPTYSLVKKYLTSGYKKMVCVRNKKSQYSVLGYAENQTFRRTGNIKALVLGNGPSLRGFDFRRFMHFDTFGMNAAYRFWYEIGWFPQYYSCLDLVVGDSHREAIFELIRNSYFLGIRGFLLRNALIVSLGELAASPKVFNFDLLRPGFECWTPGPVTTGSHTCAWATILGYKEIYLLGIDCNYIEIVNNAQQVNDSVFKIIHDAPNPNYFFDSYQKKGDKYNVPNPRKDLHLQSWRNVGEKIIKRSKVFNTSFFSKVNNFPFVRFDDVEKGSRVSVFFPSKIFNGTLMKAQFDLLSCKAHEEPKPALDYQIHQTQTKPDDNWKHLTEQRSILSYDAEWKSPGNAEQRAFLQAVKFLPKVSSVLYFGFPWTTLFDSIESNRLESRRLMAILERAKPLLKRREKVITVCQYADLLKFQKIFADCFVTHLFWSHTGPGIDRLPVYRDIRVLPFPIASTYVPSYRSSGIGEKKYLYSFIEPKTQRPYLSDASASFIQHLGNDQRGLVISCQQWDFEKIIPSEIEVREDTQWEGANSPAPIEYWRILKESVFSLCPAVPDINSTWLWDSIGCGAIPVFFTDSYLFPGGNNLWKEASVFCSERIEDILALPDQLESLASDQALLNRKRHALRQLWLLYGPDYFIYDILKLFLSFAQKKSHTDDVRPCLSYSKLLTLAATITQRKFDNKPEVDLFILECSSQVVSNPDRFLNYYRENAELRSAYKQAISLCNPLFSKAMRRNLAFKNVALN